MSEQIPDQVPQQTPYEAMGGSATFTRLVEEFYRGVAGDPQLRAMYPEADLRPARERLRMFLEQYWGGPTTYSEQRGHPRLRMRHMPFAVTPAQRDRWLTHMLGALDTLELSPEHEAMLREYLTRAAHSLVNTPEGGQAPGVGHAHGHGHDRGQPPGHLPVLGR